MKKSWVKLLILVTMLVAVLSALHILGIQWWKLSPEAIRGYVLGFGALAPLVFFAGYAQPFVPIPISIALVTSGLAFGVVGGVTISLLASVVRGVGQFTLARMLGREAVERIIHRHLSVLDRKIGENGFLTVLLLRIIPNVPFDIQNFSLGFSKVRFIPFVFGTALGLFPVTVALVFFGHSLTDASQIWMVVAVVLLGWLVWFAFKRILSGRKSRKYDKDVSVLESQKVINKPDNNLGSKYISEPECMADQTSSP